jgi:predicted metal-dependent RNase
MQKRICFTLDTEKDMDVLTVLEEVPRCLRGSFIKVAITMDINTQRDEEILKMYPNFLTDPMRYKIVKHLLKQQRNRFQEQGSVTEDENSTESQLWAPPVIEVPQG